MHKYVVAFFFLMMLAAPTTTVAEMTREQFNSINCTLFPGAP
jgi:hypothetical protein